MVDCHGQQLSKVPRDKSQACIIFISGSFQPESRNCSHSGEYIKGSADNKYDFCQRLMMAAVCVQRRRINLIQGKRCYWPPHATRLEIDKVKSTVVTVLWVANL